MSDLNSEDQSDNFGLDILHQDVLYETFKLQGVLRTLARDLMEKENRASYKEDRFSDPALVAEVACDLMAKLVMQVDSMGAELDAARRKNRLEGKQP